MKNINIRHGKLFDKYKFRCQYCGYEHYKTLWLLKMRLMFTDKVYYNCPKCHKINCFRAIFNLRHDSTDSIEKNRNREKLFDDRM